MAVHAGCTQTILVNVIFAVAVNASTGSVTMLIGGLVAVNAQRFKMFAHKFEVGKTMIKRLLIQTHDVGVAALMIGMAGGALICANVVRLAMKPLFLADVLGDILMTVKAQRSLF
jgi:hypothetical protein